ncbi:MAG: DUF3108 domain-containing protein [Bacteroidota bacterium]
MSICILLLLLVYENTFADGTARFPHIPNQEFQYAVRYGPLRIGTIRLAARADTSFKGSLAHHLAISFDSNPDIPFVHLQSRTESYVDAEGGYTLATLSHDMTDSGWVTTWYDFDYKGRKISYSVSYNGRTISQRSEPMQFDGGYQDGLSLLLFLTQRSDVLDTVLVPTVVESGQHLTLVAFNGKEDTVLLGEMGKKILCFQVSGRANYTALFGVAGDFQVWISADSFRVPVQAKLRVLIGSIVIKLERWPGTAWGSKLQKPD